MHIHTIYLKKFLKKETLDLTYIHDARIENFTSRTWIEIEKGIRKKGKKKKNYGEKII